MVVVVRQGGVVVVLAAGYTGRAGAVLAAFEDVVVVPAEEAVLPQSELVAGLEPPHAGAASEALYVIDLGLCSHHVVIFAEAPAALVALGAEQSGTRHANESRRVSFPFFSFLPPPLSPLAPLVVVAPFYEEAFT